MKITALYIALILSMLITAPDLQASLWRDKLTAGDGANYDYFGADVSISADVCAVGAYLDDDNYSQSGSVYIFRFDGWGWAQEQELLAWDPNDYDYFGISVAVSDDICIATAPSFSEPENRDIPRFFTFY